MFPLVLSPLSSISPRRDGQGCREGRGKGDCRKARERVRRLRLLSFLSLQKDKGASGCFSIRRSAQRSRRGQFAEPGGKWDASLTEGRGGASRRFVFEGNFSFLRKSEGKLFCRELNVLLASCSWGGGIPGRRLQLQGGGKGARVARTDDPPHPHLLVPLVPPPLPLSLSFPSPTRSKNSRVNNYSHVRCFYNQVFVFGGVIACKSLL